MDQFILFTTLLEISLYNRSIFMYNIKMKNTIKSKDRIPITAILLAAGRGKRLRPFTDNTPKTLLVINNRYILDYILDALKFANYKNLFIVTNYLENKIISYVTNNYGKQFHIKYCHQNDIVGAANAVLSAGICIGDRDLLAKRPILICATDYIVPINYIRDLTEYHINGTSDITVSMRNITKEKLKTSSLAVMNNNGLLYKIIEKPDKDHTRVLVAASMIYIVPACIFDYLNKTSLSKRKEYELADVINMMIDDGFTAKGYLQSELIDLENNKNLICTQLYFSSLNP